MVSLVGGVRLGAFAACIWLLNFGCSDWFGSSQAPQSGECTKDLDELTQLLVQPQTCSTSEECPDGSFCSPASAVCDWECFADSDCGVGVTCNCQGQCDSSEPPPDPETDVACPRDEVVLQDIAANARSCELDEDCPHGSRCDPGTETCTWDCLSTENPSYGCTDAGEVCDCLGACVESGAAKTPDTETRPRLVLAPETIQVMAPPSPPETDTGWGPRRIDVGLVTEDQAVADASTGVVVNLSAPDGVEISCDPLGATGTYGTACSHSGGWTFVADAPFLRASQVVWARPITPRDPELTLQEIRASSDQVSRSPVRVGIETIAETAPGAPQPLEGVYRGYVEFKAIGELASETDANTLRLPVVATATASNLEIYDPLAVLSENGKIRVSTGYEYYRSISGDDPQEVAFPAVTGSLFGFTFAPQPPNHDPDTATLSGEFSAEPGTVRYSLSRTGDSTACASSAECPAGFACEVGLGVCAPGPVHDGSFEVGFSHQRSERWVEAIQGLMESTLQAEGDLIADSIANDRPPRLFTPDNVYDGQLGVASQLLETHTQIVGANWLVALPNAEWTGNSLGYADFEHHFQKWTHEDNSGHDFRVGDTGAVLFWTSGVGLYYDFNSWGGYPTPTHRYASTELIPCIGPGSPDSPSDPLYNLDPEMFGTCQPLYDNFKRVDAPLASPATIPADVNAFLAAECLPVDDVDGTPLWDSGLNYSHPMYLCPYKQALLGPLNPATLAERMLCYDPAKTPELLLETRTFGADALGISGDLVCTDGRFPSGVDLVTHADGVAAGEAALGAAEMVDQCLSDLTLEPPLFTEPLDKNTARSHYETFFSDNTCFSPANFYGALQPLADRLANGTNNPADLIADKRIPAMFVRLLQQWLLAHSFIAKQALEQERIAQVLRLRPDLSSAESFAVEAAPGYQKLLERMEDAWALLFSQGTTGGYINIALDQVPAEVGRDPDYRPPTVEDKPHHEQPVGLPVTMVETAVQHLELVDAYLEDTGRRAYAECRDGGDSTTRVVALERAGRALRFVMLAESKARAERNRVTEITCTTGGSECPGGTTCDGDYLVCVEGDGSRYRQAHSWSDRMESGLGQLHAVRDRVVAKLDGLSRCENPSGLAEREVPLYFGDVEGNSSRFFASSDYLLNGWAAPAVNAALASLSDARSAWLQSRNSDIQQSLTSFEAERRVESISAQYGRMIIDACGLVGVEAKDALDAVADGQISLDDCYFDKTDEICVEAVSGVDAQTPEEAAYERITDDTIKYQLCLWDKVGTHLEENGEQTVCSPLDPDRDVYPPVLDEVCSSKQVFPALREAIQDLGSAPANYTAAGRDASEPTFSVQGGVSHHFAKLYVLQQLAAAASMVNEDGGRVTGNSLVAAARAECAEDDQTFQGREHLLPDPNHYFPERESIAHCFRGYLGESALQIIGAQADIDLALASWAELQDRYDNQVRYCAEIQSEFDETEQLIDRHNDHMRNLSIARSGLRSAGSMLSGITSGMVSGAAFGAAGGPWGMAGGAVIGGFVGALSSAADGVATYMEDEQRDFALTLTKRSNDLSVKGCFHEADQIRVGYRTAAAQIQRAFIGAEANLVRMNNFRLRIQQTLHEGQAAVSREEGRTVPSVAHHYWLDEHIDRFERDFEWARHLTALAVRAVEYEFQQSLGLDMEVVAASHPDELKLVIERLQQAQLTRTINSRRPEDSILVLSLRDQILRLSEKASKLVPEGDTLVPGPGERNWSPTQRFQHRLWSEQYVVRDDEGNYLGQGVPFSLDAQGPLELRCAERMWRMTATLQGDLIDVDAPAASLFVIRNNTFASQWCDGRSDGSSLQTASLQPASQLLHPDQEAGSEGRGLSQITAMIQPWFNVPRSELYREAYIEGASAEFAGRGLYGDYILLFPWKGLLEDGFPLEQVEDVLIRFDYLSVDDISL
jgi:hypothetical protein